MKTSVLIASVVVFSALLSLPQAFAQNRAYPPSFPDATEEVYKTIGNVEMRLWIFSPTIGKESNQPRPAIVFFFGGGWRSGSPKQFEHHCRYLASQGMVAITADYRVRSRHNTPAIKCVEDGKSAVRWVRENANRLGVDPNRIVAGGGSAGGHVAACTGVIAGLDDATESSKVSSVPNALALFNPALLLAPYKDVEMDESRLSQLTTRMGVKPDVISPIHHVRAGLPPTIIFHGTADTTVPYSTVERYTAVAKEAGNECELVSYDGAAHGFFNHGRGGDTPGKFYRQTVYRLHEFLRSLGYLESEPAIEIAK